MLLPLQLLFWLQAMMGTINRSLPNFEIRKRSSPIFLVPFLFFLLSCHEKSRWTADKITSEKKTHTSTRLSYFSKDRVNGIDLEILRTEEHLKLYFHVHSTPIPTDPQLPTHSSISFLIGDEKFHTKGYRMKGGQKILLNEKDAEFLLATLAEGKQVQVFMKGYKTVIDPHGFIETKKQLESPFFSPHFFRLPF